MLAELRNTNEVLVEGRSDGGENDPLYTWCGENDPLYTMLKSGQILNAEDLESLTRIQAVRLLSTYVSFAATKEGESFTVPNPNALLEKIFAEGDDFEQLFIPEIRLALSDISILGLECGTLGARTCLNDGGGAKPSILTRILQHGLPKHQSSLTLQGTYEFLSVGATLQTEGLDDKFLKLQAATVISAYLINRGSKDLSSYDQTVFKILLEAATTTDTDDTDSHLKTVLWKDMLNSSDKQFYRYLFSEEYQCFTKEYLNNFSSPATSGARQSRGEVQVARAVKLLEELEKVQGGKGNKPLHQIQLPSMHIFKSLYAFKRILVGLAIAIIAALAPISAGMLGHGSVSGVSAAWMAVGATALLAYAVVVTYRARMDYQVKQIVAQVIPEDNGGTFKATVADIEAALNQARSAVRAGAVAGAGSGAGALPSPEPVPERTASPPVVGARPKPPGSR